MTEISRPWSGSATGDAGPYTSDQWQELFKKMFGSAANEGVFQVQLNELSVSGSSSPLTVESGRALVRGTWYEKDASSTVTIPTPSVSTRIDYIVLQKDWAAQTVRVARIPGTEGAGAPSLTQTDGVTWEIPLAQASITTGGVITVSDARYFLANIILRVGTFANRPNQYPYEQRMLYYAVDTDELWYSSGSAWVQLFLSHADLTSVSADQHHNEDHGSRHDAQTGADPLSGGTPSDQDFGDSAATGTGEGYALEDHLHGMPSDISVFEATKGNMEAEATVALYVPPDLVRHSPGVCKAWAKVDTDGTLLASYNVTSVSHDFTGQWTVTIADNFSGTDYVTVITPEGTGDLVAIVNATQTAGTFEVDMRTAASGFFEGVFHFAAFGDQ